MNQSPFFTIAIPAYKRDMLLKESVDSCLNQTFKDFELLIGNDDPSTILTPQQFGADPRIRIINRPGNLGAVGNMNALIQEAYGRYFVWLSDDDLFMPNFLELVHEALIQEPKTRSVYTSFISGYKVPLKSLGILKKVQFLSGREFLKVFLGREIPIQCWYGVFEIGLMKDMGGMKPIGNTWDVPCADMLFPLQAAQAGRVALIEEPLVFFRLHNQSISTVNTDYESYRISQLDFLEEVSPILSSKELKADFNRNLYLLMKWFAADYFEVMRRSGGKKWWKVFRYWSDMEKYSHKINGYIWLYRFYMLNRFCWLVKHLFLGLFRRNSA